jgi:hypothetical protein
VAVARRFCLVTATASADRQSLFWSSLNAINAIKLLSWSSAHTGRSIEPTGRKSQLWDCAGFIVPAGKARCSFGITTQHAM